MRYVICLLVLLSLSGCASSSASQVKDPNKSRDLHQAASSAVDRGIMNMNKDITRNAADHMNIAVPR